METVYQIAEALLDALKDSLIIIPFMFAAYLMIGALERGGGRFMLGAITGAGKIGPLIGGALGAAPSCGFSAAASNLYGAGVITVGTLIAVFLSTSDEMLAVMISERTDIMLILKIILIKAGCAVISGFALDFIVGFFKRGKTEAKVIDHTHVHSDGCCGDGCCTADGSLVISALKRTLRVVVFIIIISFAINVAFIFFDVSAAAERLAAIPFAGCILAGLVGLIPNCAVSVAVTQLYLDGIITAPIMLSALLAGAGSGFLVLFRSNKNARENILICIAVYVLSVLLGTAVGYALF